MLTAALTFAAAGTPALAQVQVPEGVDPAYMTAELNLPPEDVEAVRQVVLRLNHALDAADYDLYGSFFAPEAEFVTGFGTSTGPEGIAEAMRQSSGFTQGKRHVSANLVISGEGDRAVVTSYQVVFERVEGLTYAGSAFNVDTLERRDGEWLVVRHDSTLDPATAAMVQEMMGGSGN
ncbi:nuclear transport factor 2 family protein [Jannaschia aquimarina]|nr:nuclear transport factor 2 family protein [Jannaschia aquimarina]